MGQVTIRDTVSAPGRRVAGLALGAVALAVAAPATWWALGHNHPSPGTHDAALLAHLSFLVVGFGAVLVVDWVGLLWLLRRRTFTDVLDTATDVAGPIWLGYAGLVVSGLFLEPDLTRGLTQVKMVLVFLVGWNGLVAAWLHHRLSSGPRRRMLMAGAVSAFISQFCWWGALVIGHLNSQ